MLLLKLLLVPSFLLLLSLASQRFGPAVAGWLAGLPVIAGPVLFILAIENGSQFAATAAAAATAAILASMSFGLTFAHVCRRLGLSLGVPLALLAWFVAAWFLTRSSPTPMVGLCLGAATVIVAPRLFPTVTAPSAALPISRLDLILRMVTGAALTLCVTLGAQLLGPGWSGVLAVAPVLTLVLGVASYCKGGAALAVTLLRAMSVGLYSFTVFCITLTFALPHLTIGAAFGFALLLCIATQRATQVWLLRSGTR